MTFPTEYNKILERLNNINPKSYGRTRNFLDGDVTYLSPYISRGVISTRYVFESCINSGFELKEIYKFAQELAWRDYWQLIWVELNDGILDDIKRSQPDYEHQKIALNVIEASTEISMINEILKNFYKTGYMHNHARMYIASLVCNIGKAYWKHPADWMYYHLLDADVASNHLSWQWVAGSNAYKKYYFNQKNLNRYTKSSQKNTYLDHEYSDLVKMPLPNDLKEVVVFDFQDNLPKNDSVKIDENIPTYIYNAYNIDPNWDSEIKANRILLFEPSVFQKHPMRKETIDFIINLSKNIPEIQIFTGEFSDLIKITKNSEMHYKEHPLNQYNGIEHSRDWMSSVKGNFSSFFKFWKLVEAEISNYAS